MSGESENYAWSDSLHKRAIEAASCGVVISDMTQPDSPIIEVNSAFERMTGYQASEVVGRNCRFLQGDDTDRATVGDIREALSRARPITVTLRNHRKNGEPFWNELHMSPVFDANDQLTHFIGIQTDVTARIELAEQLRYRAFHDELTGLANRAHFMMCLRDALRRGDPRSVALLNIDLDEFKPINDRYGHSVGDQVLIQVAERLQESAPGNAVVARIGGDEFVILLTGLTSPDEVRRISATIHETMLEAVWVGQWELGVRASIGMAIAGDHERASMLYRRADAAMYKAKREANAKNLEAPDGIRTREPSRKKTQAPLTGEAFWGKQARIEPVDH